jgi:hypothetical protein
VPEL